VSPFEWNKKGCDGGATVEDKSKPGGAGGPASFEQAWDAGERRSKQHQKAERMQSGIRTELFTSRAATNER